MFISRDLAIFVPTTKAGTQTFKGLFAIDPQGGIASGTTYKIIRCKGKSIRIVKIEGLMRKIETYVTAQPSFKQRVIMKDISIEEV